MQSPTAGMWQNEGLNLENVALEPALDPNHCAEGEYMGTRKTRTLFLTSL